jgi:hypothetical protein
MSLISRLANWVASADPEPENAHPAAPSARKPGSTPAAVYRAEAIIAAEAYRASKGTKR